MHSFHRFFHRQSLSNALLQFDIIRQNMLFVNSWLCFCLYTKTEYPIRMNNPILIEKNAGGHITSCILFSESLTEDRFCGISIQTHIRHIAGQVFIVGLCTDHGAIIAAQGQRGHKNLCTQFFRCRGNIAADS